MYNAYVFAKGKWRLVKLGYRASSFRIPHYTTRKFFHHGSSLHIGQVHSVLRWANKRDLPFKYIKVG